MYSMEELREIERNEEEIRFDQFSAEDAIALSGLLFETAKEQEAAVCWQVVLDGHTVVRCFMTGTDESNIIWLERKKNSVLKSHKSSLRCGMEAELLNIHEPWHADEENYVIRGGGVPIWKKNGEFVGALCISGLVHTEDHNLATKVLRSYFEKAGAQS